MYLFIHGTLGLYLLPTKVRCSLPMWIHHCNDLSTAA